MKKLITPKEFQQAIEVVNNYKKQVTEQFEQMKADITKNKKSLEFKIPATKETTLRESSLSARACNALTHFIRNSRLIKDDLERHEITIGHFEGVKLSEMYGYRNFGKKTLKEIEFVFHEAGINTVK